MKKIISVFIVIVLSSSLSSLLAWDTTAAKFMPLEVGNVWVYSGFSATIPCHGSNWYDKYIMTGTTQISGKTYFLVNHTLIYTSGNCKWSSILFSGDQPIRLDSTSMNLYKRDTYCTSGESLVDSLKAGYLDSNWECPWPGGRLVFCSDTASYYFCGYNRPAKLFRIGSGWDNIEIQRYAMGIGLVSYLYYCGGTYQINLRGCVIDGVMCGDTSMPVGIRIISSSVPNEFGLSQNYPNPFNPTTKIKFDVPVGTRRGVFVQMKIYDILGREIAILVNEQLKPGTYEVSWDASNYPSGVYFYKIQAGVYSASKKMILIK